MQKKQRKSNLELYRIIAMLLIMCHHYVVNSGLMDALRDAPLTISSSAITLMGAWGKAGINSFLLITGFFMCKSEFSWDKLLKLYMQVAFYSVIIYIIFCLTGLEEFHILDTLSQLWPFKSGFARNFTGCFIMFYLFIPFLNILIKNLDKRQHGILCLLLLGLYSILPSLPKFKIEFNYIEWFAAIYIMAAYIRFYGLFRKISHIQWGWITLLILLTSTVSILGLDFIYKTKMVSSWSPYYFMFDCNKIVPLMVAVSSFMWFKDLKIPYSKLINIVGAATFGVFTYSCEFQHNAHLVME